MFDFPSSSSSDGNHRFFRRWRNRRSKNQYLLPSHHITFSRAGAFNLTVGSTDDEESSDEEWSAEDFTSKSTKKIKQLTQQIEYEEASEAFAAIKENLKSVEKMDDLKKRVARVVQRANEAAAIGQGGFSQDLLEIAAGLVVEQQVAALGYDKWIDGALVRQVVDSTAKKHRLSITNMHQFPRVIPSDVQEKIKQVKGLFSYFQIVFTNPQGHKVTDRDPILFGTIRGPMHRGRLYYVTDWIDEYCDLRFDEFIAIGEDTLHDKWKVQTVPIEPTDDDMTALVKYVREGPRIHRERGFFARLWDRIWGF